MFLVLVLQIDSQMEKSGDQTSFIIQIRSAFSISFQQLRVLVGQIHQGHTFICLPEF